MFSWLEAVFLCCLLLFLLCSCFFQGCLGCCGASPLFSVAFGFVVVGLSLLRGKENTGHKAKQTPQKGQAQVPKQPQEEEEQQYKAKQAKKDPATKATEQQETAQQKENHDN
ncbi:hypothetical protein QYF36_005582 [Acer negundo]|nr:hypothetical protein QYF36_005582 [Acer negundo]